MAERAATHGVAPAATVPVMALQSATAAEVTIFAATHKVSYATETFTILEVL